MELNLFLSYLIVAALAIWAIYAFFKYDNFGANVLKTMGYIFGSMLIYMIVAFIVAYLITLYFKLA
jgi:accessory gene regulator protein AgrB